MVPSNASLNSVISQVQKTVHDCCLTTTDKMKSEARPRPIHTFESITCKLGQLYAPECDEMQRGQSNDPTHSLVLTIVVLPAEAVNVSLTLVILGQAELLPARLNPSAHDDQLILIEPTNDSLLRLGSTERGKLRERCNTA